MLEVINVPTAKGAVDCWMDIQKGQFPNVSPSNIGSAMSKILSSPQISPIKDIVKIGETLSVLVYLKDPKKQYDIRMRDCWAYDNDDYDLATTTKLQLTDKDGCPRKKKLIGFWQKTTDTGKSDATLIVHNNINAFKFPDREQVFLTCNIEVRS